MTHVVGIRLKNFACFRGEQEIAPLGPKPYAIVGRLNSDEARSNWLGKSTLVVALRYAFFGVLPRQYEQLDDAISRGEEEMAVDVELSDGSFVARERKRGKWTKLKLISSDPLIGEVECNQDEAQKEIIELLGLDLDNYDVCADIAQKKSDRFATLTSGQLTDIVQAWVGIDRLVEAEDVASKALGRLNAELVEQQRKVGSFAWATEEEGRLRSAKMKLEDEAYGVAQRAAEVANRASASHQQWVEHQQRADQAAVVTEQLTAAQRELQAFVPFIPANGRLAEAEEKAAELLAARKESSKEVQALGVVARGKFDGVCPVLPGFECPARADINRRHELGRQALDSANSKCERIASEELKQRGLVSDLKGRNAEELRLQQRIRLLEATLVGYAASVEYIRVKGRPPAEAPPYQVVDGRLMAEAKQAFREFTTARIELVAAEAEARKLEERLAPLRIAVLALERAQRRVCEGVVQRVEQGANQRLQRAGVDLRVEFHWGRETNKLATRCGQCGAEFPSSAKVKQCQVCRAPRGQKIEPKLHLRFSNRSGAAEDWAGVAITLAAGRWIRERRGASWGTVVLDEPFASLDQAHRRALAGHLCQLMSDGIEQSFVIAHDRAVLESLPGRIEVTSDGDWSTVRVVV